MLTKRIHQSLLVAIVFFASILCLASCGRKHAIDKGSVAGRLRQDVQIGETKSEVAKYLDSVAINGVKPVIYHAYMREPTSFYMTAPNNDVVKVEGTIYAGFPKNWDYHDFCSNVGAIFYFDKSDRLINYRIDCFR